MRYAGGKGELFMSHEAAVHQIQTDVLRQLLFSPEAKFSELQKTTGIESDHIKFHIRRLVENGYIEKRSSGSYSLTVKGKEYANKLDTDAGIIERQPKTAVIIVLRNKTGEVIVQERLKHPYFGFWGYPGGKIRWGETILEAGGRELFEETGLSAELVYRGVYHEHVKSAETGELIEDKIFHVLGGSNPNGELQEVFEGGRNAWVSLEDLALIDKKYSSTDIETAVGTGKESFIESVQIYTKNEF